jgi:hypothetical protein
MVGNPIEIPGAGGSGSTLATTIASVADATHVTLADSAITTVSTAVWTTRSPINNIYIGPGHIAEDFKQGAMFDEAVPWLLAAGHPA